MTTGCVTTTPFGCRTETRKIGAGEAPSLRTMAETTNCPTRVTGSSTTVVRSASARLMTNSGSSGVGVMVGVAEGVSVGKVTPGGGVNDGVGLGGGVGEKASAVCVAKMAVEVS